MKGEGPVVVRKPHTLSKPFRLFPPRIDRDWPEILARIPLGYGLEVPVSHGTVTMAVTHLTKRGVIKRFEYVANKTRNGHCIIYHVRSFLGELLPIQSRPRRIRFQSEQWDRVLREVLSGKSVIVDAPYTVVYQALYRRIRGGVASLGSISFQKIRRDGKERVKLRKK